MEKNFFKKICGTIDYNTYTALQANLVEIGVDLTVVNELLIPPSLLHNTIDILAYSSLIAFLGMTLTNGKEYTKDIKQIRELYNYFLNNYNKLNKIFDLNNPVEIYTMFNYLLYKGYLSKNKEFQFYGKQVRDLKGLIGAEVITGKAVCRHISGMLTDILNGYGIESSQLGVYKKDYHVSFDSTKEQKYTSEELANWVRMHMIDEEDHWSAMMTIKYHKNIEDEYIKEYLEFYPGMPEMFDYNILKRKIGNHIISFAFKDGKSYFLDPTQTRIYRMKESDKDTLYDGECDDIPIRLISSILLNKLNNSKDYLQMKKRLSNSSLSITAEEEQSLVKATLDKCKNNMEIFEQFYVDNCELYDEISSKVLNIKHKSFIKKIL